MQRGKRDRAPELMRGKPGRRLNARLTAMSLAQRGLVLARQLFCEILLDIAQLFDQRMHVGTIDDIDLDVFADP